MGRDWQLLFEKKVLAASNTKKKGKSRSEFESVVGRR